MLFPSLAKETNSMELGKHSHEQSMSLKTSANYYQSRPMNVERIVEEAQNFDFNIRIPLKYWLRTASTLLKEAKIYQHEGNEQEMYRLLFRHATLVLRHLSIHPDSRQPNYRLALLQANKDVEFSLANLEILKPRLNKRYETYTQLLKDQDARLTSTVTSVNDDCSHLNGLDIKPPSHPDPVIRNSPACLISGDTKDLTVILAQSDTRKWAPAKANASHGTVSKEEELEYMEDHRPSHRDGVSSISQQGLDQQSLGLKPLTTSLRVKVDGSNRLENKASRLPYEYTKSSFSYPEVHRQNATENAAGKVRPEILEDNWPLEISTKTQPPERPPKAEIFSASGNEISPKLQYETVWDREDIVRTMTPFSPSLHLGTPNFTFKYSASLENGALLRTVFLPPSLRLRFLSLALPNTEANLETCGILCGTLISNALFISKLVIPDQESTSDTCETINEDKLFDYVDGEDLMVLGWIHTHPTQTCFMSSRDLHTHAGYQAMMPESIAIVCAPSKGDWGVFRLTDPPGLSSVLKCTQTGLFHPHADNNIYTDALRPGHVYEAKGLEYDVVDLRRKV